MSTNTERKTMTQKPETNQSQQPSQSEELKPQEKILNQPISSDGPEPDWDTIKTPDEIKAEENAELEAITEGEELAAENEAFHKTAKKGAHLILGGIQKGIQFGMKSKSGYGFPELDLKNHEPALSEASACAYELLNLDPDNWFAKFLHFSGNIDARYIPLIAYGQGVGEAIKAGFAEIAKLNAEAEKQSQAPIGMEAPQKSSSDPIETPQPKAAPETKLEVIQ